MVGSSCSAAVARPEAMAVIMVSTASPMPSHLPNDEPVWGQSDKGAQRGAGSGVTEYWSVYANARMFALDER